MPLLQRMNNQNLEVIQGLKEEVKSAGVTNIWFTVGVGISILISCSILLFRVLRRHRAAREIQQVVDKFQMTEDGHTSKGVFVPKDTQHDHTQQINSSQVGNSTRRSVALTADENC